MILTASSAARSVRKRPQPPSAWDWVSRWARSQDVDPELVPLAEATERLLSALERASQKGSPLSPPTVRLAALLLTIEAQLAIQGIEPAWQAARPFIERAYARDRAQALTQIRENREITCSKPTILEPEPVEEPSAITLWDLIQMFQKILDLSAHNASQSQ